LEKQVSLAIRREEPARRAVNVGACQEGCGRTLARAREAWGAAYEESGSEISAFSGRSRQADIETEPDCLIEAF
ncbi:hypothetical protein NDU88_009745, partial [Pleurodeles waltl]